MPEKSICSLGPFLSGDVPSDPIAIDSDISSKSIPGLPMDTGCLNSAENEIYGGGSYLHTHKYLVLHAWHPQIFRSTNAEPMYKEGPL